MVLALKGNHKTVVTIPALKIVEVVGPAEDDRFVIISLDGEQFHVFASDLANRASPLEGSQERAERRSVDRPRRRPTDNVRAYGPKNAPDASTGGGCG